MSQIPDADYIRDAEMNGIPSPDPVQCPICGKRCEEIYMDINRDAVGCDCCMKAVDAYDWFENSKEE